MKRKAAYSDQSDDEDESTSSSSFSSDNSSDDSRVKKKKHKKDSSKKKSKKKGSKKSNKKSSKKSKKSKKDKKEKKSRSRHSRSRNRYEQDEQEDNVVNNNDQQYELNYLLADAIYQLVGNHPIFAEDLPILLIKLANGQTLNLSQMPSTVANGLDAVFQCLISFGVIKEISSSCWKWNNIMKPPGSTTSGPTTSNTSDNDLVLVKIVRTLLDQIGITADIIEQIESPQQSIKQKKISQITTPKQNHHANDSSTKSIKSYDNNDYNKNIKRNNNIDNDIITTPSNYNTVNIIQLTYDVIKQFATKTEHNVDNDDINLVVVTDLITLSELLIQGEMISVDNIPNETLRTALGLLFQCCGLEKSEMEFDDDDDVNETTTDNNHNNTSSTKNDTTTTDPNIDIMTLKPISYGYGLPEQDDINAKLLLTAVRDTCERIRSKPKPLFHPIESHKKLTTTNEYDNNNDHRPHDDTEDDTDDDEGPLIAGISSKKRFPPQMIIPNKEEESGSTTGVREEWMIVPGKFDLLSNIEAGRTVKSRTFQQKGVNNHNDTHDDDDHKPPAVIDPVIQKEIETIRQIENKIRGPTLLEIHLQNKKKNDIIKQNNNNNNGKLLSWKWNREDDLGAGRGVDNDALRNIVDGAKTDLKTKFHGSGG